jgi:DNA-binding CsgD family transcriptional regulator
MPQMSFLKNRFDLTPAEARLVVHLITGESLRPCAKALGIKYETVRTCLKSVFQKTKTHRQAELVLVVIRALEEAKLLAPRAVTAASRYPPAGSSAHTFITT